MAAIAFLLASSACWADLPGTNMASVDVKKGKQSGVVVDSSNPISVTTATKYTDSFDVSRSGGYLSADLTIDTTASMSIAVTVEGSNDGTTFKVFDSAVTVVTITADYDKITEFSIPAVKYIRLGFASDASDVGYEVDKVWIASW